MRPIINSAAEEFGLTRGVLASGRYVQPVRNASVLRPYADDLATLCRAVATVLPADAVFTHWTSALLRRWWLPDLPAPAIIACSDADAPHLDRRGVYVRRCGIPPEHRTRLGDLPVASAAWTIIELAEHLSLVDLVVVIDGALHLGHVSIDEIRRTMRKGRRGVRVLRRALDLCDGRSESAWETILRLLHVLSGVEVRLQHDARNALGVSIARGDLRVAGTKRLVEYDGEYHRDRKQHQLDLARDKRLARAGYDRFGYIKSEIVTDPGRIVRDADDVLGRTHDPMRLGIWKDEFEASSLSTNGRRSLVRRLRRFVRDSTPRPRPR